MLSFKNVMLNVCSCSPEDLQILQGISGPAGLRTEDSIALPAFCLSHLLTIHKRSPSR